MPATCVSFSYIHIEEGNMQLPPAWMGFLGSLLSNDCGNSLWVLHLCVRDNETVIHHPMDQLEEI